MTRQYIVIALFISLLSVGQNGKLLSETPLKIADTSREHIKRMFPESIPSLETVNFSRITYLSDGLKVVAHVAAPKKTGKYPCIIYNRGGNREDNKWDEVFTPGVMGVIADWGYIVVGSQFRGNDGGEGKEEFGGSDVNDVLNLIPLLGNYPGADTTRMGIYGWSRGGMMTYLALARTNRFKAAVVGSGMSDAFSTVTERPRMETYVFAEIIPDFTKNRESALEARSVIRWAEKLNKTTPLLIMHGAADLLVSPRQALTLADRLYKLDHPFRFILFEGGDHFLSKHEKEVNLNSRSFLDTYVRDGEPWPGTYKNGNQK